MGEKNESGEGIEDLRERKQFIEQRSSGNSRDGWDSEQLGDKGYAFSIVTEGEGEEKEGEILEQ